MVIRCKLTLFLVCFYVAGCEFDFDQMLCTDFRWTSCTHGDTTVLLQLLPVILGVSSLHSPFSKSLSFFGFRFFSAVENHYSSVSSFSEGQSFRRSLLYRVVFLETQSRKINSNRPSALMTFNCFAFRTAKSAPGYQLVSCKKFQ